MTALSRVQALAPWAALAGVAWLCHRTHRAGETLQDVRSIVTAEDAHIRALTNTVETIRGTLKEPTDASGNQIEALTTQIARLRAGADPTPRDEAAHWTPGQLWHRLTTTDPDDRRRCLEHITEDLDTAWNCRANAHDTTVTELRVAALRVGDLTAALREIVNTLGPDGTAPCDCDDRALANEAAEALRIAREALAAEVQGG